MKIAVPYGKSLPIREIASFQRAAAKLSRNKLVPVMRILLILIGALLIAATFLFSGGSASSLVLLILGAAIFLIGLFYFPYLAWQAKRHFPKRVTSMVFEFAGDGVHVANQLQNAVHPYPSFSAIGEGKFCYFLFLTEKQGYFIPKRTIPAASRAGFGAMLEQKFQKKLIAFRA